MDEVDCMDGMDRGSEDRCPRSPLRPLLPPWDGQWKGRSERRAGGGLGSRCNDEKRTLRVVSLSLKEAYSQYRRTQKCDHPSIEGGRSWPGGGRSDWRRPQPGCLDRGEEEIEIEDEIEIDGGRAVPAGDRCREAG